MSSKTNAMRILDKEKIDFRTSSYDASDGKIDGVAVANKVNLAPATVFKTLVTHNGENLYVFVIPVEKELDLKKAAKVAGEKKLEMLHVKDLLKWTGYVRGGCSPIGMKKAYPTFIDNHAEKLSEIAVSAGKIGMQIIINPNDLAKVVQAKFSDLTKEQ
ncbi:Cys-tRNA(Pro) deacylase [Bacillus andreraoultii]|uniref:Cys-tRNA(Pro) deacylase n=1 Tax=Bacillus andreraoultii TaxID=1499685 RepID=UPI000539D0CF|nr:Cys-tRNA(Pro) deacylase [Bacillus andreraoultii]